MDPEKPASLRSLLTRMVCTLIGLLLLYALSIGPAAFVSVKFPQTNRQIDMIYHPLVRVCKGTPLEAPLLLYMYFGITLAGGHME